MGGYKDKFDFFFFFFSKCPLISPPMVCFRWLEWDTVDTQEAIEIECHKNDPNPNRRLECRKNDTNHPGRLGCHKMTPQEEGASMLQKWHQAHTGAKMS